MLADRATAQTLTTLHSFTGYNGSIGASTNRDGQVPRDGLILSDSTLYGTTQWGGTNSSGTIFKMSTNGTGFTSLYNFTSLSNYDIFNNSPNSDGALPWAGLIMSGNTLYGTAQQGGTNGTGTVFAVNTNGAGFTDLHSFSAGSFNGLFRNVPAVFH